MEQMICNAKLTRLIDEPTRTTSHSATLIDIILTNKLDLCYDVVLCSVGDHDLITVTLDISKTNGSQPNLLITESQTMNKIFITHNVDIQVSLFKEVFSQLFELGFIFGN